MRKIFYILILITINITSFATATDYIKLYEQTNKVDFTFYNNIDPYQDEDNFRYAYSPYPLFRTSTDLYFKDTMVPHGYYILTPRHYKNRDIVLFKVSGKVSYIIPAIKKEPVPFGFYEKNIPKVKKTKWQKFHDGFFEKMNNFFKSSRKVTPPSAFITAERYEHKYLLVKLYYAEDIYVMLFNLIDKNQY